MNYTIQIGDRLQVIDESVLPFSFKYPQGKLTLQKIEGGFIHCISDGEFKCDLPVYAPINPQAVPADVIDLLFRASHPAAITALINEIVASAHAIDLKLKQAFEAIDKLSKEIMPEEEPKK